jgi:hypothetical protein
VTARPAHHHTIVVSATSAVPAQRLDIPASEVRSHSATVHSAATGMAAKTHKRMARPSSAPRDASALPRF